MSEPFNVIGESRKPLTGPRYYDESKNAAGVFLPGVPLRDLTAEEFEALQVWLQYSVDAQPFYSRTPIKAAPQKATKEE